MRVPLLSPSRSRGLYLTFGLGTQAPHPRKCGGPPDAPHGFPLRPPRFEPLPRTVCSRSWPHHVFPTRATWCKVYTFPFALDGTPADMVFTSVAGHLLELEFVPPFHGWQGCSPGELYSAPVRKQVPRGENEKILANLQAQARRCAELVLWLDCDREGENIAFEVIAVCTAVNPRLHVRRARFSALVPSDILRAIATLGPPNENDALAVDARQEIDLRIGASFTRLQTLLLQVRRLGLVVFFWGGWWCCWVVAGEKQEEGGGESGDLGTDGVTE